MTQFLGVRDQCKPTTNLLTIKQESKETLGEYIARFNNETLQVEDCTDETALMAVVNEFKDKKFLRSQAREKRHLM